jgi:hypothetical protein
MVDRVSHYLHALWMNLEAGLTLRGVKDRTLNAIDVGMEGGSRCSRMKT